MSYLDICKVVKSGVDAEFVGCINPRRYIAWKDVDPMILLIEGIHQFCVKAVKKGIPLKKDVQLVPVQLKDIHFRKVASHDAFKVTGKLKTISDLLHIDFIATRRGLLASGTVVVSDLKGISE